MLLKNISTIINFKKGILIVGMFFYFFSFDSKAQIESRLNFSEANYGLDFRTATYKRFNKNGLSDKNYINQFYGVSARLQASIVGDYLLKHHQKKFRYGEITSAEIGFGATSKDTIGLGVRFVYKFDFGFGCYYSFSQNQELGVNFFILHFTNEGVMPRGSGSAAVLRYRCNKIVIEPSLESHNGRTSGWLQSIDKSNNIVLQASLIVRYCLSNKKQFGIRLEQMPFYSTEFDNSSIKTTSRNAVRLFYGLTF